MSQVIPVEREAEQLAKESRRYGRRIAEQRQRHRNLIRKGFSAFGQHTGDDANTIRMIHRGYIRAMVKRGIRPGPVCHYTFESAPTVYGDYTTGRARVYT